DRAGRLVAGRRWGVGDGAGRRAGSRNRYARRSCPTTPCARSASGHRTGHVPHRTSRRRAADWGRVAVAALGDRLDYLIGAKAAESLDEVFGIQTVDDL